VSPLMTTTHNTLRQFIREQLVRIGPNTDYVLPTGNMDIADPMAPVIQAKKVTRSALDSDALHDSLLMAIRRRDQLPKNSKARAALDILADASDEEMYEFISQLRGVSAGPNVYRDIGIGVA